MMGKDRKEKELERMNEVRSWSKEESYKVEGVRGGSQK